MEIKGIYNSDINSFGGIQDYFMIHESLRVYFSNDEDLSNKLIKENIFGVRTEEGRGRFYRGIKSSILKFHNSKHEQIYQSFFTELDSALPYNLLVFWQLSVNNHLFYNITKDLYLNYYFQGKATVISQDVFYYLQDLKQKDADFEEQNWTKKTTEPVASKYLTVLRKLGLVEGVQKKHLLHIQISDSVLALFSYLLIALYGEGTNFLNHHFLPFSFVSNDSFVERIKRLGRKGLIDMTYTGTKLTIHPILKFEELADGLFRRSQSEI